jgi:hypothetical protein
MATSRTTRFEPARSLATSQGSAATPIAVDGRQPSGIEVEILRRTRATAISFGFRSGDARASDFAALTIARLAWRTARPAVS